MPATFLPVSSRSRSIGGWAYGAICRVSSQRTPAYPAGWTPITDVDRIAPSVRGRPQLASVS